MCTIRTADAKRRTAEFRCQPAFIHKLRKATGCSTLLHAALAQRATILALVEKKTGSKVRTVISLRRGSTNTNKSKPRPQLMWGFVRRRYQQRSDAHVCRIEHRAYEG